MATQIEITATIESIQFELLASNSDKSLNVSAFTSSPYVQTCVNLVMSGRLNDAIQLLTANNIIR